MWTTMKNHLLGKKILSCSFYLYGFRKYVSCGFLIIIFCNPGVHYQTLCISCNWPTCFPSVMHCTSMQGCTAPLHYVLVWLGASSQQLYSLCWLGSVIRETVFTRFGLQVPSFYRWTRTLSSGNIFCVCAHTRMHICGVCASVGIIFMIPPKDNAQHRIVMTRNGCCHLVMFCGRWFSIMLFWLIGGTFIFVELHLYGEQHISFVHYCVVSIIYYWYTTVWVATCINGTLLSSQSQHLFVWYFLQITHLNQI